MQQKQQLSRADLQGQALTHLMLFSVSLMHLTLCLGSTDSCRASTIVRERLRSTSRTTLNEHLNAFHTLCRKQLTLSRVAGNRVQSSQPLAPSITKVSLSQYLATITLIEKKTYSLLLRALPFPREHCQSSQLFHTHIQTEDN